MIEELRTLSRGGGSRAKLGKLGRTEERWGYAFIGLWLVGFLAFTLIPMVASLVFSLYDFQLSKPEAARFIGLGNWRRLLFTDPLVWQSLRVTFTFALISLPINVLSAFFLAVLLNSKNLVAAPLFRTLFYAPVMVPAVAGVLIWSGVLNPSTGWINQLVETLTGRDVAGA